MTEEEALDSFGEKVMGVRDMQLRQAQRWLEGRSANPVRQSLIMRLYGPDMPESSRQALLELCSEVVDGVIHALLFLLESDAATVVVHDGVPVSEDLDGLVFQLFGDDGWIARYSEWPPSPSLAP